MRDLAQAALQVQKVLKIQRWKYIFTQLTPLVGLKEEPEILPKLMARVDEF